MAYVLIVRNAGPSTAAGVTLTNPTPAGLTLVSVTGACTAFPCNLASVASGAVLTTTVTFQVPPGYTTPDPIVNTATVSSSTQDPAPGNNTSTASTALGAPVADLTIAKTNGATTSVPGTTTTYTITVGNQGPSTATNAVVTDTFPALLTGVTWSCAAQGGATCPAASGSGHINATVTIPASGVITFTATGTINPAATGTLANTATAVPASGTSDPTSASATDTDTLTPLADLAATKTGPPSAVPGKSVTYTITVVNNGPSVATGVLVRDVIPDGLSSLLRSGSCTSAAPCVLGTLAPNESRSLTVIVDVPVDFDEPTITDTASAVSDVEDPTPLNDTATVSTPVIYDADLRITKTVSPTTAAVGESVNFTITVTNDGPAPATGVAVADFLSSGIVVRSFAETLGTHVVSTGEWQIGTLLAGESAQLTLTATITEPGVTANLAVISSHDSPDPGSEQQLRGGIGERSTAADVAVRKTVDNAAPTIGQNVTFTIKVTNNGPNDATGIVITDALPPELALVSATPTQGTYAGSDWTVGDLLNGAQATLTIVATVSADTAIVNVAVKTAQVEPDRNPLNNQSSVTLNGAGTANLGVFKAVDRANVAVGEVVTFKVAVGNLGPAPATGVTITDLLPPGLTFVSALESSGTYVASSGAWTVGTVGVEGIETLVIQARVAQAGTLTNTATVSAIAELDPETGNNTASASVTAAAISDLSITKSFSGAAVPGGPAAYGIVVRNIGPSPVTGASVSDTFPAALSGVTWTCTADPGSSCGVASGSGSITTTVTLEAGAIATFAVTGMISPAATGSLSNTATVAVPTGVTDPDLTNDSSTSVEALVPSADVQVQKTGPATVVPGTNVQYPSRSPTRARPMRPASCSAIPRRRA